MPGSNMNTYHIFKKHWPVFPILNFLVNFNIYKRI